jgi:hypothetical protein
MEFTKKYSITYNEKSHQAALDTSTSGKFVVTDSSNGTGDVITQALVSRHNS